MKLKKIFPVKLLSFIMLICFAVLLFNFLYLLKYYGANNVIKEELVLSNPIEISFTDQLRLLDDGNILIYNETYGSLQLFNSRGEFLGGIQVPTFGGSSWVSFNNNALYIFIARGNLLYKINYPMLNQYKKIQETENYIPKKFYFDYPFETNDNYNCKFSFRTEILILDNFKEVKEKIVLNAPVNYYPGIFAWIVTAILILIILVCKSKASDNGDALVSRGRFS